MYEVEHLKSGLSLSTHIGCPLNCEYCILRSITSFSEHPKLVAKPQILVKKIIESNTLFLEGATPLIINNRTDPFLPEVIPYTKELLELLSDLGTKSPIVIITKLKPNVCFEELSKKLNLIVIYSYSTISSDCNHGRFNEINEMRYYFPYNALFHYYRPIIPCKNDDIKSILKTIELFYEAKFDGSILSGFRITANNRHLMYSKENDCFEANHKLFNEDIFLTIDSELDRGVCKYDVFRHTSCAIDCSLRRKNRLGYYEKEGHCSKKCSNYVICNERIDIDIDSIMEGFQKKVGRKMDYRKRNNVVVVEGELNQEEVAFAQNAYGIKIHASRIINSPSEMSILHG